MLKTLLFLKKKKQKDFCFWGFVTFLIVIGL
jgi:hypothetical protein